MDGCWVGGREAVPGREGGREAGREAGPWGGGVWGGRAQQCHAHLCLPALPHNTSSTPAPPATSTHSHHPHLPPPTHAPQEAQQESVASFESYMESCMARDWAANKRQLFGLIAPNNLVGAGPGGGGLGGGLGGGPQPLIGRTAGGWRDEGRGDVRGGLCWTGAGRLWQA